MCLYLSVCLSMSLYLPVCLSMCLYLSVCLSMCLCLSVCRAVTQSVRQCCHLIRCWSFVNFPYYIPSISPLHSINFSLLYFSRIYETAHNIAKDPAHFTPQHPSTNYTNILLWNFPYCAVIFCCENITYCTIVITVIFVVKIFLPPWALNPQTPVCLATT